MSSSRGFPFGPRAQEGYTSSSIRIIRGKGSIRPEPYTICEECRQKIGLEAPNTVKAVELVPTGRSRATNDAAEGLGVLFHEDCFPGPSLLGWLWRLYLGRERKRTCR